MMDEYLEAYLGIFRLNPKLVRLNRVKLVGKSEYERGNTVYSFVGIVTAPCKYHMVVPSQNRMVKMRNKIRTRGDDIGGLDLLQPVSWRTKKKKKKKKFDYSYQLDPASVLGFEVVDGMYYIKVQVYGLFYS